MKNEADVKKWLQYSEDDSKSAQYLYNNMRPIPCEIICFHCQQAAEKLIKGLLVAKGISFAKKHDLLYLITLYNPNTPVSTLLQNACSRLSIHGVNSRYPNNSSLTEEDAKKAFSDLKRIGNFVKKCFIEIEKEDKKRAKLKKQQNTIITRT